MQTDVPEKTVYLSDLKNRPRNDVREIFSEFPYRDFLLTGDFGRDGSSSYPMISEAFSYLPKYTNHASFIGMYLKRQRITDSIEITHDDYVDEDITEIYISSHLSKSINRLPSTISKLSLAFKSADIPETDAPNVNFYFSIETLITTVASLKSNINELDLSGMFFHSSYSKEMIKLFNSIPETVKSLTIKLKYPELIKVIPSLPKTIIKLNLSGSELHILKVKYLKELMQQLPPDLEELHLNSCQLNLLSPEKIHTLFDNLPPKLKVLRLRYNQLGTLNQTMLLEWIEALKKLPGSFVEVDLGNNALLLLDTDTFKTILDALPLNITTIRLSEWDVSGRFITGERLATQLNQIPPNITTVSFSAMNFFGIDMNEFIHGIQGLPSTVHCLDFSQLFNDKDLEETSLLYSKLPVHINAVNLSDNLFYTLDSVVLGKMFNALAPTINEIDLSDNGFDGLLFSQLKQVLNILPEWISRVILDKKQFAIRNNGTLISYPADHRLYQGLFRPQGALLRHQRRAIKPISENYSHEIVRARIDAARLAQAIRLDLSDCGLNKFRSLDEVSELFDLIPVTITELNFRFNGFGTNNETRTFFSKMLSKIPGNISYLDLNDNGFELDSVEQLKVLFLNITPTVKMISLGQLRPLSPEAHISVRQYPDYFVRLRDRTPEIMQQVRTILNDYTQSDSGFLRFLTFHWNSHHTAEVAQIIFRIDLGLISNISDVLSELQLIELNNETGTLAKIINFLTQLALSNEPKTNEDINVAVFS